MAVSRDGQEGAAPRLSKEAGRMAEMDKEKNRQEYNQGKGLVDR